MKILFRDRNTALIEAWRAGGHKDVDAAVGSPLECGADAIVSPANSFGFMDGGIDLVYCNALGWELQHRVQVRIASMPFGELLVGQAIAVLTPQRVHGIDLVIVAPTMRRPKSIDDVADVMLATRAAVRCALEQGVNILAMPGMGTGCGGVPVAIAVRAMSEGIRQALEGAPRPATWIDVVNHERAMVSGTTA